MAVKKKVRRNFVDRVLGFPVQIPCVEVAEYPYGDVPLMDYELLSSIVLERLACKPTRLTGNEVRFIRLYFEHKLSQFGRILGCTHACVSKWEKTKNKSTGMAWGTEQCLRQYVMIRLGWSSNSITDWFIVSLNCKPGEPQDEPEPYVIDLPPYSESTRTPDEEEFDVSITFADSSHRPYIENVSVAA